MRPCANTFGLSILPCYSSSNNFFMYLPRQVQLLILRSWGAPIHLPSVLRTRFFLGFPFTCPSVCPAVRPRAAGLGEPLSSTN